MKNNVDLILQRGRWWREVGWSLEPEVLSWAGLTSPPANTSSVPDICSLSVNTTTALLSSDQPPVMSEVDSLQPLQPWQIFCSMFAVFWLFSAWCDQVLITLLLCIVFGVLSDVITKSMYSGSAQEEKGEPQASPEEKKRSNERIWREAEAELEEEEGCGGDVPPPLPAKDYTSTTEQNINSLADKLQALVDRDEATEQREEEEQDQEDDEDEDRQPPRQYNRTVSDEYNQNTSAVNYNNREGVIEEEGLGQETINDNDEDDDDDDDENNSEEEGKIYAKDSSDEEDYDYASKEVNFNESESETEEEEEGNDDDREPTKKTVNNTPMNLKDEK